MPDPVSVYLPAAIQLERDRLQFRELGVMFGAVGDVLRQDWKKLSITGHATIQLPKKYIHPEFPHELDVRRWPDADQLSGLLAKAHATLSAAICAWEKIPFELRAMLQQPVHPTPNRPTIQATVRA